MDIPERYAREAEALRLRRAGLTFAAIGKAIGRAGDPTIPITTNRAVQLVQKAEMLERRGWEPPSRPPLWPPPPDVDPFTTDVIRYSDGFSNELKSLLIWHGFRRIRDLTAYSAEEFLALKDIGRKRFGEVREFLHNRGLSFRKAA